MINVSGKRCNEWVKDPYFVYIGRMVSRRGYPDSDWKNKYILKSNATDDERKQSIENYRKDLLNNPTMLKRIPELRSKKLGCWCKPELCHGDVLKELAELPNEELQKLIENTKSTKKKTE